MNVARKSSASHTRNRARGRPPCGLAAVRAARRPAGKAGGGRGNDRGSEIWREGVGGPSRARELPPRRARFGRAPLLQLAFELAWRRAAFAFCRAAELPAPLAAVVERPLLRRASAGASVEALCAEFAHQDNGSAMNLVARRAAPGGQVARARAVRAMAPGSHCTLPSAGLQVAELERKLAAAEQLLQGKASGKASAAYEPEVHPDLVRVPPPRPSPTARPRGPAPPRRAHSWRAAGVRAGEPKTCASVAALPPGAPPAA